MKNDCIFWLFLDLTVRIFLLDGFVPPADEIEGRTMGKTLKFWNWSMFDGFRGWVEDRRQQSTTFRSGPIIIINHFSREDSHNQFNKTRPTLPFRV